jgi:hypothetical protein
MTKLCLAVGFLIATSSSALGALPPSACPDTSQGETQQDCPWAGLSRELSAAHGKDLEKVLKSGSKPLYEQLKSEHSSKAWHSLWGYSINFDELAHGQIVDPEILKLLYSLADFPPPALGPGTPDTIEHAGLEHTYGYLFSVLKTSFGYKRSRWVGGEINQGFAFPSNPISASPKRGSLFRNVTYFIGSIAFRGDASRLNELQIGAQGVDPALVSLKYDELKVTRVEETLLVDGNRKVVIRTDLVPFPVAPAPAAAGAPAPPTNDTLLVYSIVDWGVPSPTRLIKSVHPILITAFPVTSSFGAGVTQPGTLGDNQPIITRYNAYIPGVTGRTDLKGTRKVIGP